MLFFTAAAMDANNDDRGFSSKIPKFSGHKADYTFRMMQFTAVATIGAYAAAFRDNGNGTHDETECPANEVANLAAGAALALAPDDIALQMPVAACKTRQRKNACQNEGQDTVTASTTSRPGIVDVYDSDDNDNNKKPAARPTAGQKMEFDVNIQVPKLLPKKKQCSRILDNNRHDILSCHGASKGSAHGTHDCSTVNLGSSKSTRLGSISNKSLESAVDKSDTRLIGSVTAACCVQNEASTL
jgi:hypothetical protein